MTTAESTSSQTRSFLLPIVVLISALAVLFFLRWHSFQEPLELDEASNAIIAWDWAGGGKPYVTLADNKPIGTYILHRGAIALFGYKEGALKIFAFLSYAITTVLLFFIFRRRHSLWESAGLLFIWVPLTCYVRCFANGVNVEVYLLPLLVGAYLLADLYEERGHAGFVIGSGILIALSLLIKQVTLPFLIIPWVLFIRKNPGWKNALLATSTILVTVVLVHSIAYRAFGYSFVIVGENFLLNASYASSGSQRTLLARVLSLLLFPINAAIIFLLPLTIAGIAGLVGRVRRDFKSALLPLMFVTCAAIAVVLPGKRYAHYFIVFLPALVLMLSELCSLFKNRRLAIYVLINGIVWMSVLTWFLYLRFTPDQISHLKYAWGGDYWFVRDRAIGEELFRQGMTGKRIFVEGNHCSIYFYSKNHPATKYMNKYFYGDPTLSKEADALLDSNPPDVIVVPDKEPSAYEDLIARRYQPAPALYNARIFILKS